MKQCDDLQGRRFGMLVVLEKTDQFTKDRHSMWMCKCDCGNQKAVARNSLTKGLQSCGCIRFGTAYRKTHGMHGTKIYGVWQGIIARCERPSHRSYIRYGAKGISVCDRWRSFESFYEDMKDGYAEGLDIDRTNNSGNYEPGNCRWVTRAVNCRNRSSSKLTEEDVGVIKSILQMMPKPSLSWLSSEFQVSKTTICEIGSGRCGSSISPLIAY